MRKKFPIPKLRDKLRRVWNKLHHFVEMIIFLYPCLIMFLFRVYRYDLLSIQPFSLYRPMISSVQNTLISCSVPWNFSSIITKLFYSNLVKNVAYPNVDKESDLTTLWLLVTICYTLPDHVTKDWHRAWLCLQKHTLHSGNNFYIPFPNIDSSVKVNSG